MDFMTPQDCPSWPEEARSQNSSHDIYSASHGMKASLSVVGSLICSQSSAALLACLEDQTCEGTKRITGSAKPQGSREALEPRWEGRQGIAKP